METIKIDCQGLTEFADLDELHVLQKDLKSLTRENFEAMAKQIKETGYAFPIHVWIDKAGKKWIVAGTQRKRTLTYMRDEMDFEIPKLPIVIVGAKDPAGARRRVLQDISQYGTLDRQGLYEFMEEGKIHIDELDDFHLPMDNESFKFEFFKDPVLPDPTVPSQNPAPIPGADPNEASLASGVVPQPVPARAADESRMDETRKTYLSSNIKQIVLYYEGYEFEDTLRRANYLLNCLKLEDFSALFRTLIEMTERQYETGELKVEGSEQEGVDEEVSSGD
jgi:hypothetical protein